MAPPPSGAFRGRKLLPWVAAAVLLGALVVTGRLLDDDRAGAPAGRGPTRTGGTAAPSARPAGTVEIEGFSLVPTSRAFQASCRQAADRLGFAVPCPELLPIPASGETPSRLCQEAGACRDELVSCTRVGTPRRAQTFSAQRSGYCQELRNPRTSEGWSWALNSHRM